MILIILIMVILLIYICTALKNPSDRKMRKNQPGIKRSDSSKYTEVGRVVLAIVADVFLVFALTIWCGFTLYERIAGIIVAICIGALLFISKKKVLYHLDGSDIAIARINDYILRKVLGFGAIILIFAGRAFFILDMLRLISTVTILQIYIVYFANRYIYLWEGLGKRKILDIVILIGMLLYFFTR